jgi:HK97 family phage prohead protease
MAEPQTLTLSFDAEDVQFRVDADKRTISGLLLPWGKIGNNGSGSFRFRRGSVKWSQVGRIKLLRDHDRTRPVGVATALEDREDGLHITARVASGPSGDEVLSLAGEGILDGFSAGLMIDYDGWEVARDGDERIRDVIDSSLKEATVTAMPAFDDARVARVNASLEIREDARKDDTMTGENKNQGDAGQGGTDPTTTMETFEDALNERFDKVTEKLTELQTSAAEGITQTVADALKSVFSTLEDSDASGRAQRSAARIRMGSEEPVYRFDGSGTPSLVHDFWAAQSERDHEAIERLRKFQAQQRDMVDILNRVPKQVRAALSNQNFDVNTGNASEVIPPGYRPDLFVNELMQGRPLVALSSRGTITNATPFVVPKFVSSTDATDDHTEGVNPAEAELTLDQETVSPGAISGRFKLTREVVDAANPAIDAIALATMRESYNRQTEGKAYAALNGVALSANTATTSGDEGDILSARSLLARYPFSRFAAPTGAAMNQTVTNTFATAVDTTGRPLLPSVGAANAAGLGNAVTQGWFIDGLAFAPAWAITDAVGDDVALIVNRSDFWTWESPLLTFRFEEKEGPAHIELALFAYYGTTVLRPAGVFALRNA